MLKATNKLYGKIQTGIIVEKSGGVAGHPSPALYAYIHVGNTANTGEPSMIRTYLPASLQEKTKRGCY